MTQLDFHIANFVTPSKKMEDSDQLLERAQALFDEHRVAMDPLDCEVAYSLLQRSTDLRVGFEDKCLLTQSKQARLYCAQVDETLEKIQAILEEFATK